MSRSSSLTLDPPSGVAASIAPASGIAVSESPQAAKTIKPSDIAYMHVHRDATIQLMT
jgi:hypothetical protein